MDLDPHRKILDLQHWFALSTSDGPMVKTVKFSINDRFLPTKIGEDIGKYFQNYVTTRSHFEEKQI